MDDQAFIRVEGAQHLQEADAEEWLDKIIKEAAAKLKKEYGVDLARIMHHLPRFCMPGPHAYCTRTPSIRPVWIGVRQLAVQLVWV